jgi:hypothetical protein
MWNYSLVSWNVNG